MKYLSIFFFLIFGLFLTSCRNNQAIQELSTPCDFGGEPNLFVSNNGKAYLSWVEYINDTTDVLAFSTLEANAWSAPIIIAKGSNWFVNWADFPSLVTYAESDQHISAHWLQKSAKGTYDYDIHIAQSNNGGKSWKPSFHPHTDGIAAEHGFVSMLPVGENKIFATWLDGRYTKTENASDGHEHEGHGGAMTLRGVFFDIKGNLTGDIELDNRVCDCCSTSAALTKNGVIIAYRDRSEDEIRDISIIRQIGNDWTRPRNLYADNWEIAGCPVNGPKVIADKGNRVAIAWYTMAKGQPQVKLMTSTDAGATFSAPIRIDAGNPLGRVDLVFDKKDIVVSWMEKLNKEKATIRLAKVGEEGNISKQITVEAISLSRSSGFPILSKYKEQLILAWTKVLDKTENTTIKTVLINF